jgi:hypothetical protein
VSVKLRCCLFVCTLFATRAVFGQAPGIVTTLPRPVELAQLPSDTPPSPPSALPLIPNNQSPGQPAPGSVVPGSTQGAVPPIPPYAPPPVTPTGPAPPGPPPYLLQDPQPEAPPPIPLFPDDEVNRRIRFDFLELDLLYPHINETLNETLNVGGLYTTTASLPISRLGFATPLAAQLAYILPNLGEIDVTYRLLASEGDSILATFDPGGPAALRSRMDANIIDVGITSTGYGPWRDLLWRFQKSDGRTPWTLNWDLETRFASIFFDSEAIGPTLDRHISNYFYGAGPRGGLTLTRWFPGSGLSIFERVDAGVVFGESRQQFSELNTDLLGNPLGFGYTARAKGEAVPVVTLQFGVSGESLWFRRGTWEIAYQLEQWWGIGNFSGTTANLTTSGLVLKWSFRY